MVRTLLRTRSRSSLKRREMWWERSAVSMGDSQAARMRATKLVSG
jgi:hypothetical protein